MAWPLGSANRIDRALLANSEQIKKHNRSRGGKFGDPRSLTKTLSADHEHAENCGASSEAKRLGIFAVDQTREKGGVTGKAVLVTK
jgi:hypothetical protein